MWPNQLQQLPQIKLTIEINNIKKIYIVILPILDKLLGTFCQQSAASHFIMMGDNRGFYPTHIYNCL